MIPRFLQIPRGPDFVIGGADDLRRWWVIPRNRWFNVYLHNFCRSDDDCALHDPPWCSVSIILRGCYFEHLTGDRTKLRKAWRPWAFWRLVFRRPSSAHRVELLPRSWFVDDACNGEMPVWTLFLTGPRVREWGFLCPNGWRHWRDFTNPADAGATVGRGCE